MGMSEMYDSEDGKDAWKQYRRLIESIDPAVQSMLHTFGSEQYQYGYSAALDAAWIAVGNVPCATTTHGDDWHDIPGPTVKRHALAAIDGLRGESNG